MLRCFAWAVYLQIALCAYCFCLPFFRLRKAYEEIAEKALTTPANTEQLMELKEYMEKVQQTEMLKLEKKMDEARQRWVGRALNDC